MKSMGGVAVLHPQDSLNNKKSHRTIKFNQTYTNSPSTTPSFTISDNKKKTKPKGILKKNNRNTEVVGAEHSAPMTSKNLVMGQVNLLKRGETLNRSNQMVPDSHIKNNTSEFFAGYAFSDSPPPSSVPLPGFFMKNFVVVEKDDPTTELRRILGLSL